MTFAHSIELAVLRTLLEADEIEYRVLDELTVEVIPIYSDVIGGVKLQVRESDVEKAIEILKDGGYIKDEDLQPSKSLNKFANVTSQIPLLKKLRPELRLIIIVTIALLGIIGIVRLATLPSTYERLTKQSWCVEQIIYNGKSYAPNTVEQLRIIGAGFCQESISIRTNGTIILPGFNSHTVFGKWVLDENSLQILQTDTFDFVYNGFYDIDFSGDKLILKSEQTTLYCYPQNIRINLPF